MILFASPDFGAGACIYGFLLLAWAVVLVLVTVGIVSGFRKLEDESSKVRKWGLALIFVSGFVPFVCCLGPSHVVRLTHGNYPIGRYPNHIEKGMTMDEVTASLGSPHVRSRSREGEYWTYWIDSFAIGYCGIYFGPDERVTGIHGN